jgi:putative intracellular protease/amidase
MKLLAVVVLLVLVIPAVALGQAPPNPTRSTTASANGKVLLLLNEAQSGDLELMLTKEVGVMTDLLRRAGYDVVLTSSSGRALTAGAARVQPAVKVVDLVAADYRALVIPCMAASGAPLPAEGTAFIKTFAATGKPIAAQTGGVVLLARAGLLSGKKFAIASGWVEQNPELKSGIESGDGIVQDGRVISSGVCPYMAKQGRPDGTTKLTQALIAELQR